MRWILAAALPLALGGCVVTSEAPLFGPQDATRHPLAQGLWGMSWPGCEVVPLKDLPECALGMTIVGDKMDVDPKSIDSMAGNFGPGAEALKDGPVSRNGPSTFMLVDGEPAILQLMTEDKSPGAAAGRKKPGYMAVTPLHSNAAGQVDKAVMWIVTCPSKTQDKTGFKMNGLDCVAQDAQALRRQARHLPPLLSFYLTWAKLPG